MVLAPVPTVREATLDDARFLMEGNITMAMESESHKLDEAVVGPGVEAVLRDPSKGRFFIAEVDGEQAAQLLITFEWSDWRLISSFQEAPIKPAMSLVSNSAPHIKYQRGSDVVLG
mmetsp:Transcript_19766/g.59725  ORF Transcript_19766/g.59725 Transcript_19766/m.59725 type:complete len:116 (+) Transcript_19766:122-469(+)